MFFKKIDKKRVFLKKDYKLWKENKKKLKDNGIKVFSGYYETESPICGCGTRLDHRDFGKNGKIERNNYYIDVKEEEYTGAVELLK